MLIRIFSCVAALAIGVAASAASAQGPSQYPDKPIRFLVGFPPGGSTDIIARLIAPELSSRLGQPVVLDNRSGAGGVLGVDTIAKSAPDGYTIGLGVSGALTSNVTLMPNLPYDPVKDLMPVTRVIFNPMGLVVNSSSPAKTLQEFIALAKTKPGKLSYGTAGPGTAMHLAGELLKQKTGIFMAHIPYRGASPAATDLLGGQVDAIMVDMATVKPFVDAGRLRVLAVTSAKRSEIAPDVPTMAESGVPGYEFNAWIALLMPAATPPAIVSRINREMTAILNEPRIRDRILELKMEPAPTEPKEMLDTIRREIKTARELIKAANVSLN